jgi:PAS domain S-box-containing protein
VNEPESSAPGGAPPAAEAERIAALEAELAAARRTIDVLVARVERALAPPDAQQSTMQRAFATLEQAVRSSDRAREVTEAHYRTLHDLSPDLILTLTPQGTIRECNQTASRVLGRAPSELTGVPVASLFEPASGVALSGLLDGGFVGTGDTELQLRDGRRMAFSVVAIDAGLLILVLRDVTQRLLLEAELQEARRLASVGRLAGALAHEINNPLAVLNGRLDLLLRQPELAPDRVAAQLAVLRDHCRRIAAIVMNLQTFARPQAPRPVELDLLTAMQRAVQLAGRRLERQAVRVEVERPGLRVAADPDQLDQVLVNLLTIAAEASQPGRAVHLLGGERPDAVRISVGHEGVPLPEDVLHGLRAPGLAPGRALDQGMGLPLAIAWTIVQGHGGWLTAENRQPQGATFHVFLRKDAEPAAFAAPAALPRRPLHLLVVDDDQLLRHTVEWMLAEEGMRIDGAQSAEDALRLLQQNAYDAVLSDINLPGMDGEALVAAIQQRWPALVGRTILTSGLIYQPRLDNPYLQKPFSRRQLLSLLQRLG